MVIMDRSDSATFVMGDLHAFQILKKSCADVFGSMNNNVGSSRHPLEFETYLHDKEFLFKVELNRDDVKVLEPSFTIVDVCKDPTIVAKFKESDPKFQSTKADLTGGVYAGETPLAVELQDVRSNSMAKDLLKDFNDEEPSMQFSQAENDVLKLTPGKRNLNDTEPAEEGHLSSTKMKTIKMEKA